MYYVPRSMYAGYCKVDYITFTFTHSISLRASEPDPTALRSAPLLLPNLHFIIITLLYSFSYKCSFSNLDSHLAFPGTAS